MAQAYLETTMLPKHLHLMIPQRKMKKDYLVLFFFVLLISQEEDEKGLFSAILLRPLNIPRRVLSSSAVKCVSLMVAYSFCISTICFIFFISYLLTFYDDTRKLFRSSRIWAQLRDGVRERIA